MCGRYTISNAEASRMAERFGFLDEGIPVEPRFNVAPTQQAPVVIQQDRRLLRLMRWGLVPSWAKDAAIGNQMINARAETLATKPSFKGPLRRRRCLVPADGFYEWRKAPGQRAKVPMRFVLKDGGLFAFGGLWDAWRQPDGSELQSFTIVTVPANELIRPIHDRMPVILLPENEDQWLKPDVQDVDRLVELLRPHPADGMDAYEVSTLVNSPANDRPECIQAKSSLERGSAAP